MNESAREWIGMSDLMTGLMLVFLFLAVLFMMQSEREREELERANEALALSNENLAQKKEALERVNAEVEEFRVTHIRHRDRLHKDLNEEFEQNLSAWDAEILPNNTIRFKAPEVLFEKGENDITPKFAEILMDFFPRYVGVLTRPEHKGHINEIRIVGHTSSEWESADVFDDRYLNNMELSQGRAFSVLEYCFRLDVEEKEWLGETLHANGLAFAQPVRDKNREDPTRSRRVEFKVLTKTEEKVVERLLKNTGGMKK